MLKNWLFKKCCLYSKDMAGDTR